MASPGMSSKSNDSRAAFTSFIVPSISQVTPSLYLGDREGPTNIQLLNSFQIKCIFAFTSIKHSSSVEKELVKNKISLFYFDIYDDADLDIRNMAHRAHIIACRFESRKLNVLYHCDMGISRSTTALLIHLLYRQQPQPSLTQAYQLVTKARPIVSPNEGFERQLEAEETRLKKKQEKIAYFRSVHHQVSISSVAQSSL